MIERNGDLFDTDATYIGHGVNCQGVMGAGIAKTFRDLFPENYRAYRRACGTNMRPGHALVTPEQDGNGQLTLVVNFASQDHPGPDAKYEWVLGSMVYFAKRAVDPERLRLYGSRVAIPEIGCGIGGLKWDKVKQIIETVELCYPPLEFEVWHYDG